MEYLKWKEETISDFSDESISKMYDNGFVFTRIGKGVMHQTRSVRIDLKKFELSSENRRILRKGEEISLTKKQIPHAEYSWKIAKLAKDFYDVKAGGAFSANKIKELIERGENFNSLYVFSSETEPLGYAICYQNEKILHYSYPFYDLKNAPKDMGLIMMTKAIADAQMRSLEYVYLGSLQRPSDTYKLQFSGIEWFDGKKWQSNLEKVKMILNGKDE
jgi:arginyl-tRNA--protein-N-Asp/Glu arginylyltransferase